MGAMLSSREAEPVVPSWVESEAATKVQALYRGHRSRKDVRLTTIRGVLEMRTNLRREWRASEGVRGPYEIWRRRHLSFVEGHLVVSKLRAGTCSGDEIGAADFVVEVANLDRVYTDLQKPNIFAFSTLGNTRDRMFRAPNQHVRDEWVRALNDACKSTVRRPSLR
mmetsp:Transcript_3551/g.10194  ORF Transcript_3551/g.10194 Transcript_3551/m.10194 type:complete len:166 (-) Transcript_3551:769-1266(-)